MATVQTRFNPDALRALLQSPQGPVVKDLIRRARKVENRAKQLCPVDTGRLRSSISMSAPQTERGSVTIHVGTNVEYAPFLEYGTSRMSARPFLEPALAAGK